MRGVVTVWPSSAVKTQLPLWRQSRPSMTLTAFYNNPCGVGVRDPRRGNRPREAKNTLSVTKAARDRNKVPACGVTANCATQ